MIDSLHKKYVCVSSVYRGGQLYNPGDILLTEEEYTGTKFVPASFDENVPQAEVRPKKRMKTTPEVGA